MLELKQITKSFGPNPALNDVTFGIRPGEIVGLAGENGAGKTTLMRIASGELNAGSGSVVVDGLPRRFRSPADASRAGIEMVHQHFMLVENFSIAGNLALTRSSRFGIATASSHLRDAAAIIARTGIELPDPSRRVAGLSVGERSKVELVKALSREPRILILDEPTSVLTPGESKELFQAIRRIACQGTGVILISHKIEEILAVASRVVVMRRGSIAGESQAHDTTAAKLATMMVGGEPQRTGGWREAPRRGDVRLRCIGISGERVEQVTFEVGSNEVVAIIGVAGNGQDELTRILRGIAPAREGTIEFSGRPMSQRALLSAEGTGHVPEDRTCDGLVAGMTIAENLALSGRTGNIQASRARATDFISRFAIRAEGPDQLAATLSGGNQQKLILARELESNPQLLIVAEPARGLDLSAAAFVRTALRSAADEGAAILLFTSDLEEAFEIADAVHIMHRGKIGVRLDPATAAASAGALLAGLS